MSIAGGGPALAEPTSDEQPRRAPQRRGLRSAGVLAAAGALVVLVVPERLGLAGTTGLAQLVALRGLLGVTLATLGLVLGVLALLLRRRGLRGRSTDRAGRAPGLVGALAVLALLGAVAEAGILVARGTDGIGGDGAAAQARPGDVVVLVQNTKAALDAEQIATQVLDRGAEVVVLPETSRATAERAASLVREQSGRELQVLAHSARPTEISSTALLVDARLGSVRLTQTLPGIQGSFVASGSQGAPTITAVHTTSPSGPELDGWDLSTRAAVATCGTASIVAGDFNATLDHPALRELGGCVDAGLETGTAGVATWPVRAPRWLGAPIDRVLVDPSVWQVVSSAVLEPPTGTDHRAVEVLLGPVGD